MLAAVFGPLLLAGNGMYQIAKTLPQKMYQASSKGQDADPKLQKMLEEYYGYIKQVGSGVVTPLPFRWFLLIGIVVLSLLQCMT